MKCWKIQIFLELSLSHKKLSLSHDSINTIKYKNLIIWEYSISKLSSNKYRNKYLNQPLNDEVKKFPSVLKVLLFCDSSGKEHLFCELLLLLFSKSVYTIIISAKKQEYMAKGWKIVSNNKNICT